ncbi:hypothetical protein [Halorubrum sodomense]|uniref:Uncharacterized protein n=1 Tax=Halorubrum sodomense TaxID=35743 RepID=A0A1I6FKK1_HALSD|nr:hypothetical protein [Halorubrum sodomense]SFR30461.1 hypothetical protein SAMN04487937_0284 [Halorubrum sodomense]
MLDAGNPYMLPSVLVGAAVYLGLTAVTDASLPIRVAALLAFVTVVPIALDRLFDGRGVPTSLDDEATSGDATAGDATADTGGAGDEETR